MTDAQINEVVDSDPDLYRLTDKELAELHLVGEGENEKKQMAEQECRCQEQKRWWARMILPNF